MTSVIGSSQRWARTFMRRLVVDGCRPCRGYCPKSALVGMLLLLTVGHGNAQDEQSAERSILGYDSKGLYTLDEWMTITRVYEFLWSPDGTHIYYTSDAGDTGTTEIFRIRTGDGMTVQLTGGEVGRMSAPGPVPVDRPEPKESIVLTADGSTLYYVSSRFFQRMYNIFRMPAVGGEATQRTFHDAVIETGPAPSPSGDLLAYFTRTSRGTKIRLLDETAGQAWPTLLDSSEQTERDPVWSPDGRQIAMHRSGDIWIQNFTGDPARRLISQAFPGSKQNPVWSPDGSRIAFSSGESGFSQIGVVEVATGAVVPITYAQREHSSVAWSPDGQWLVFVRTDEVGMSREVVVAAADGSGRPRVLIGGKGMRFSPRFSPSGDSIAYIESTGNRTRDIWIVAAAGGVPRQLTHSMGAVDPESLPLPEEVFYPAADNLRIPALLYRPPNFDPTRKYPVIVSFHGHPSQWNHGMNMIWQYFIQKGFVLIAPNPRGSIGFGDGFHDLHIGDHGGTEYEDVIGALDYLATLPYVDMHRKASEGGSGGGYISYVVATHAPGAYLVRNPTEPQDVFQAQIIRAAASSRRVHAVERYVSPPRFATEGRNPTLELGEFGGSYEEIPERYEERSPLNYVHRVEVPQLIMTGLRDGSVPFNGSKMWVQRMHELGKGDLVDYVEYPDEDHSLQRYRATIRDRLRRMEEFLEEKLDL